jgi:DNA invertase Pin-like site-specific DNA recombinase
VRVLSANGDDLTDSSDPSRKMMRQIAGAFHEYEKARLVAKLTAARDRKRAAIGKCEGSTSWAEINPELVRAAKRLRRRSPKGHQCSLGEATAGQSLETLRLSSSALTGRRGLPMPPANDLG